MSSFFLLGIASLLAGAAAGAVQAIEPWSWGRWLALHLCFVGGVSSLILGASQFFAGAFLSSDPPSKRIVRAELATWGGGSVLLAVAMPARIDALIVVAVGLLLAGLAIYAWTLRRMSSASLQAAPWATRWYAGAAGLFGVGIVAGVALALGAGWSSGDLLSAHVTLNVAGWLGTAIVGTLHTFYPSLARVQLAAPRLQAPTFWAWVAGVAALACGYGFAVEGLAIAGWAGLIVAAALLLINVVGCRSRAPRPVALPARLLGVAQLFLLGGLLLAGWSVLDGDALRAPVGVDRAALGTLLVSGWIGLTVAGSLLHLLAVVVRVRDFGTPMPAPRPRVDIALTALLAVAVTAVAVVQLTDATALRSAAAAVLVVAYLLAGSRVAVLAARVLARARPSI